MTNQAGARLAVNATPSLIDTPADATKAVGGPRRPNAARALCEERLT